VVFLSWIELARADNSLNIDDDVLETVDGLAIQLR
jgi:hypothetical protein